ncbi:MAG: chemotaxis protein CheW [Chthoniobacteraceae bacterium]
MSTETYLASATAQAGKYLTFILGREGYGISVLKVREIIRACAITSVPNMPGHIKGVINLRGKIIPVVDLRIKFSLANADETENTCIVVVQVAMPDHATSLMGLVVDAVESVTNVAAKDIEPTPDFGTAFGTDYILAMAKLEGRVIALLDIDKVVAA